MNPDERCALAGVVLLGGLAVTLSFPFPPAPIPLLVGVAITAAIAASGLRLGRRRSLGAPLLARCTEGAAAWRVAAAPILAGIVSGVILGGAVCLLLALPGIPGAFQIRARLLAESAGAPWRPYVQAFDAGVLEEIVFRLFLLSATLWLLDAASRRPAGISARRNMGIAIAVSAACFAAAHAPKWQAYAQDQAGVMLTALAINAAGGVLFGWLYTRRGIESAMAAHVASNVALRAWGPALFFVLPGG